MTPAQHREAVQALFAAEAAGRRIMLGAQRHDLRGLDLRRVGVILRCDGVVEETGLGAGVLDDPVLGIVWLARYGRGLSTGDMVLSGSFVRPLEALPGSYFDADFGDFGRVTITFAQALAR